MFALLLVTFSLGSCNSDDYLVDGGKSNPYYEGNVIQYLESASRFVQGFGEDY